MDWFTNMFTPINERTDISPLVYAYRYRNAGCTYTPPLYNFTGGNTYNNGWNYFQNNNWRGSIFGFDTMVGNKPCNYGYYQPLYNFTGKDVRETSGTNSRTTSPVRNAKKTEEQAANNKAFSKSIADTAEKYLGYNESDGSFRKFSNSTEWCADFVTYVVKETYRKQGIACPRGFGSWRCENLKQWAIDNGKFLFTANKTNKQELIKTQVKPGDIVIMREKVGNKVASHTGIVRYVDKETGNFQTIEGNVRTDDGNDYVIKMDHSFNDPEISGFIQLV